MYVPAPFAEPDRAVLHEFIRTHPLGALVTGSPSAGLYATHLPLLLDPHRGEHGILHGHIARANPHHERAGDGAEGLVIFTGPEAYVTPSWYASKARHGRVVPTWNYVAVHVVGRVRFIEDRAVLMSHLEKLTDTHEADRAHPWSMSDAPSTFVEQLVRAIVGVEIEIVSLEGKWKLSQNRPDDDVDGVINGLRLSTDASAHAVGEQVAARREKRNSH